MKRFFIATKILFACIWTLCTDPEEQLQLAKAQGYDVEDDPQIDDLKKAIEKKRALK
jgi:hypothetical protein